MKLRAYSDLHGRLPRIDPCDVLLIAGDICPIVGDHGPPAQLHWLQNTFAQWCAALPVEEIVVIPGNHDFVFEHLGAAYEYGLPQNVHLLIDSGTELAGDGPRVFGQPWVPALEKWAFYGSEETLRQMAAAIPDGYDIWMQHGPPAPPATKTGDFYALDYVSPRHVGNAAITPVVAERGPKLLICGHIHEGFGKFRIGGTDVFNVSFLDEYYDPRWRHLELEWDPTTRTFSHLELVEAEGGELLADCVEEDELN